METPHISTTPTWKKYLPHLLCVVAFAVISLAYFHPILSGKVLEQGDIQQYMGSAAEIHAYRDAHGGQDPYWTGRMFAGMPDYQIGTDFKYNFIKYPYLSLHALPRPANFAFTFFISFFILLLTLKVDWKKSAVGALMFGFTSYLYIILAAGHNSKAYAIAYLPLVLAGVMMVYYRRKYLWGAVLTAFAMGLEIYSNHVQMTYYMALGTMIFVVLYAVECFRKKDLKHFFISTAILIASASIGIGMNSARLWTTWSYQKHTIRAGSELVMDSTATPRKGLDKDYILAWSYGIGETFNLMIPDLYGGASGTDIGEESNYAKAITRLTGSAVQGRQMAAQAPTYWGDQPFTSGPAYVGAITVFLFVLGLMIVRGKFKWWVVGATLLSFLMAWGSNAMWFADMMIEHFPLYDKFRTPSSALIVSSITMPLLAILALKEWFSPSYHINEATRKRYLYIALGSTAGLCILFIFMGNMFFSFSSPNDESMLGAYPDLLAALRTDRYDMMVSDALRSAILIIATASLIWFYYKGKVKESLAILVIGVLVIADMWSVDRRYLDEDNFTTAARMEQPFTGTVADWAYRGLKKDTTHYRVWNRTVNTMNDASTSFYFNSIGGYHAAKLQRYQELWDHQISRGNMNVISMLNTKYIISPSDSQDSKTPVIMENTMAMGPAWVVDSLAFTTSAREELFALDSLNIARVAVVDTSFASVARYTPTVRDSSDIYSITLEKYEPNHLTYRSVLSCEKPVVFSEIYYPDGWNAYIDGEKVPHFRVNYMLRAMILPAGEHSVEFRFEPTEALYGDRLNLVFTLIFITGLLAAIVMSLKKNKKKDTLPA
ncbi:MAG: YfhO family protein [Flavobacteriales bacterium]|nr:YfhO family protein [Flavobacteriales bacterium]